MKIKDKIYMNLEQLTKEGPITIVAFGDSVTHGALIGEINYETVYWNLLKKKLNAFRSDIPVNVINAGICGITAKASLDRLEKQVIVHNPDLVIVCFGLNDINGIIEEYTESLGYIFDKCTAAGAEVIFMTPNMLNTYVAEDAPKEYLEYAAVTAEYQNSGKMDMYISAAIEVAKEKNVMICDCYSKWKKLSETEDTTMLLCNRINHPNKEMHKLFADSLYELLMGDVERNTLALEDTMYKK